LTPLTVLNKRQKAIKRLNKESTIFKAIIRAIQEKKGEYIVSLDLRNIPEAVADFFIICEAGSPPQIKAIADQIEEEVKRYTGENPYKQEGLSTLRWVLIDYVNIVVHIFHPETRQFYQLEEMWNDALREEHND
jgi:ribosome-associated protein